MTGSASCLARGVDAEALLRHFVDSTDDAVATEARDGTITSWNRGAERLFGYSASEAVGSASGMMVPPDRVDEERQLLRRVFAGASIDRLETERLRKDGELIAVSLTLTPVRDGDGGITAAGTSRRVKRWNSSGICSGVMPTP